MKFHNAQIFRGEAGFQKGGFTVSNGRIEEVFSDDGSYRTVDGIDLNGLYVIPGLVDIHTHGNSDCDFSDGSLEDLQIMGKYLAEHGITAFMPTSMTLPYDSLACAFETAERYCQEQSIGTARLVGIHMEGPFLAEKKKGAQNGEWLQMPDVEAFQKLQKCSGNRIRIVDVAPELPGAKNFISCVSETCRVSIAHTNALYDEVRGAFKAGASHVTHLFNAMPVLHHRQSGVIGAAYDTKDVTAELICDGLHVHPSVIRMAFQLFNGRLCLVSDALRCCGCPDGEYELGGQAVVLKNRQARLTNGTLAGAVSNLYEDMVYAIGIGIPGKEAVLAATLIPAKVLRMENEIGSLKPGCRADFLVCDKDWNLKQVYMDGVRV